MERSRLLVGASLFCLGLFSMGVFLPAATAREPKGRSPPARTSLFIAIDDLRDWTGYLGDAQARTPHLDRLAARGTWFTRSYCAAPACNPSRVALLTGLRPSSTGILENADDWRPVLPDAVTLPLHFRRHGYRVMGAGKIYHWRLPRASDWDEFFPSAPREPRPGAETAPSRRGRGGPEGGAGGIRFRPLDCEDRGMPDWWTVEYALRKLEEPPGRPFFLACGLVKPHLPWSVPRKYFDLFPLETIELPAVREDDLDDVPPAGIRMARPQGDHAAILKAGKWKEAVQAYLAAIAFADAMVGRLIEGLERSPHAKDTIVCLWSDHGWQLGEERHWRKFALWEESARAPLIFLVPGLTRPGPCHRPVDFLSIYPTLADLCGLPLPAHLEGRSVRPLLVDPAAEWAPPAITTYLSGNHSVRTERWRLIRYADGAAELYDHDRDPREWTNLADREEWADTRRELEKLLPADRPPSPGEVRPKRRDRRR